MTDENTGKSYSKLEWLFYIIILPMLFTAILAGVFMSFLGYDVVATLKNSVSSLPVVNQYVDGDESGNEQGEVGPSEQEKISQLESEIATLNEELDYKQQTIDELNKSLEGRNLTISDLEAEIKELTTQLETKSEMQQNWQENMAELSKMYKAMPPSKSAPIIANLTEMEAIQILNGMSSTDRAKIFEKMTPEKAATLTSLLVAKPDSETEEVAVLLAKIEQLNRQLDQKNQQEQRAKDLAEQYGKMSEDRVAEIIAQMSVAEAAEILKHLQPAKRSSLLEKMPSSQAAQLTQRLLQ